MKEEEGCDPRIRARPGASLHCTINVCVWKELSVTKARLILVLVLAPARASTEAPVAYPGRPDLPEV
jgi:hypothetical protein